MKKDEPTTTPESNLAIPFPGDLRDYFAGQALAGDVEEGVSAHNRALWAYQVAEAMIAEKRNLEA